jgi:hypothetical protein
MLRRWSRQVLCACSLRPPELLQYAILHEEYVRGRPNNQIMVRHNIAERTLYRYRRQGIQALAADLATREQQVPQAQPVH